MEALVRGGWGWAGFWERFSASPGGLHGTGTQVFKGFGRLRAVGSGVRQGLDAQVQLQTFRRFSLKVRRGFQGFF